ncbi:hypothetical protein [Aminipila sp.]|uniref:hypothetical protein n=1 Tax=Aminipila sp. TaxID=2060095 RepID=UPI0028971F75|nr:hypothetical protein [Aminipila sp.]
MKKYLVCVIIIIVILTIIIFKNSKISDDTLNSLEEGMVFCYDDNIDKNIIDAVKSLEDSLGITVIFINYDKTSDVEKIHQYINKNKKWIDKTIEINDLEEKLINTNKMSEEEKNNLIIHYKQLLSIVKDEKDTRQADNQVVLLEKSILAQSKMSKKDLHQLLELQKEPRIKVPIFINAKYDKEKLPTIKYVMNGFTKKTLHLGDVKNSISSLENQEATLIKYLQNDWELTYKESRDIYNLFLKLNQKDSFVLLVMGSSCVHCKKLMPYLESLQSEGYLFETIDIYNSNTNNKFEKLIKEGNYNLSEVKWYPSLIAIQKGKQIDSISVYDWSIPNVKEELGYEVEQSVLKDFFHKYAEEINK